MVDVYARQNVDTKDMTFRDASEFNLPTYEMNVKAAISYNIRMVAEIGSQQAIDDLKADLVASLGEDGAEYMIDYALYWSGKSRQDRFK